MNTTTVRYRAYAEDEDAAYAVALRMVDSQFAIMSSERIRKVRGQRAWDVDFSVTRRHNGQPIATNYVFTVIK